jgi:hypothetical protein
MDQPDSSATLHRPMRQFGGAHRHITEGLASFAQLPGLAEALLAARRTASATLHLFDEVVGPHHGDEEKELFIAVERSCRDAQESERVAQLVRRLTAEHRQIERMWARVRHAVAQTAAGRVHEMPEFNDDVAELVDLYRAHARFEEEVFLPLADEILSRNANHMAALDIALHLRHAPPPRSAYI